MKNRKSLIVSIIVVMVLVLGVGYATISSTNLIISGTAASETRDMDVVISAANPSDTSGNTYGTVNTPADKTATITVTGLQSTTDERTITYTVTNNESDADAQIYIDPSTNIVLSNSEYFDVTTEITGSSAKKTVAAGGTNTFWVKVKLKKIPVEQNNSTTDITITIKADPVQKTS